MAKEKFDIYKMVTDKILEALEKGTAPWQRPWAATGMKPAVNFVSKKAYRGINAMLLSCTPFTSPYWMTFKQAADKGGSVKKGEKATQVVFWTVFEREEENKNGEKVMKKIPYLRYYNVFNADQIEGIEFPKEEENTEKVNDPIEVCEKIVASMPVPPELKHGGDKAFYRPSSDMIGMPERNSFTDSAHYYATLFHEMGHSTGHEKRVNRKTLTQNDGFGGKNYSEEELVAEITAAFLCHEAGLDGKDLFDNTAAYIQGWKAKLSSDARLIVRAASAAQKATDFVMGRKAKEKEADNG